MRAQDSQAKGIASCPAEVQYSFAVTAGNLDADLLLQHRSEPRSAPAPLRAAWWLCLYRLIETRRYMSQLQDFSINFIFTVGSLHNNYLNQ